MTLARSVWLRREHREFVETLATTGDPARAAATIGRSLEAAYRRRETCPELAADWQRAMAMAWEQVEARVLAGLLTACGEEGVKLLESRVALAFVQRRGAPAGRAAEKRRADPRKVSALRAELLRLAGPAAG